MFSLYALSFLFLLHPNQLLIDLKELLNGSVLNGNAVKPQDDDQPTVKVLGMEMTASCEGGKKWSRPESPVLPTLPTPAEPVSPPQVKFMFVELYLLVRGLEIFLANNKHLVTLL